MAVLLLTGCSDPSGPTLEPNGVLVVASDAADPLRQRLLAELDVYIKVLAGSAPQVTRLAAGDSDAVERAARQARAGLVIVLDSESVAADLVSQAPSGEGFRLLTREAGSWGNRLASTGATFVYSAASSKLGRQYGVYEVLRRLGARFYHPEQEYLPQNDPTELRRRAARPTALARARGTGFDDDYAPDFTERAYTFHGAHPLEHLEAFSDAGHPIDEAEHVNSWIVKNRGNRFRGAGRGVSDAASRAKRVQELEQLRVLLGFPTGSGITLHNQQQGASAVVDPSSPTPPQKQIEDYVAARLKETPEAESFGVHFGPTEFTVTPDQETVDWINWAGRKALALKPTIRVSVNDHITGSQPVEHFDDLGCPPGTGTKKTCDYYDLAFHTDERFAVSVHTVMFYPLEGPARVYNQQSFAHKLCLMQQAAKKGRPLTYFPEGSWWLSFDNPIPVYLPLYIWARGRDVELLRPLLRSRGAGTLDGHRMFNSGHEWGYWQQDYAVGLLHWNADVTLSQVLGELADPLCAPGDWEQGCAARTEAMAVLDELMQHQRSYMLQQKDWQGRAGGLYAYLAGEDPADEIAAATGFEFRPVRVAFTRLLGWSEAQLEHFRQTDLAALGEMESAYSGWLARLKKIEGQVPQAGRPWLDEIVDGVEIDLLRVRQIQKLYDAVLTYREAQLAGAADPRSKALAALQAGADVLEQAEAVIRRREARYRYPAAQEYGGGVTPETAVDNGTTYPYRVHTKTHLLTYWKNRHQQARAVLEGQAGESELVLTPALADPGTPLSIRWPRVGKVSADVKIGAGLALAGGERGLDLGGAPGFWSVGGTITVDGTDLPVQGGVARSSTRFVSPSRSLTVIEPASALAQSVLEPLFPPVRWALLAGPEVGGAVVFAPDLDGDGDPSFRHLVRLVIVKRDGDWFKTSPAAFRLPIPNPGTGSDELSIGLTNLVASGSLTTAVRLEGQLSVPDLVQILIDLAGFDAAGAHAILSTVLGYDPQSPPATAPFVGKLAVSGS